MGISFDSFLTNLPLLNRMLSFDGTCSTQGFNDISASQQASILLKHLKAVHRIHKHRRIRMSIVRDLVIN